MKRNVFKTLLSLIIAAAMLLAALPATLTASAGEVSTTVLRVRSSEDFYDALWGTCQNNTYTVIIRLEEDIKVELEDGAQLVWMNGSNNYNMILDLNGHVLDLGAEVLKAWNYAANATYHLTDTVGTGKIVSDTTNVAVMFTSPEIMGNQPFTVDVNGVTFENANTMGRAIYVYGDNGEAQTIVITEGTFINYDASFGYTDVEQVIIKKMTRRSTSGTVDFAQVGRTVAEAIPEGYELRYYRYEYPEYYEEVATGDTNVASIPVYEGYDAVVSPTFAESTYAATFDPNGGSGTMEIVYRASDAPFAFPECEFTAPSGKHFVCWMMGGAVYLPGEVTFMTYNYDVAAVWSDGMKGDMDGDGEITVADALKALRIAAKLVEATEDDMQIGDVDGDGEITVSDALKILRVAAKLADASSLE